jgi:hypothetical protein
LWPPPPPPPPKNPCTGAAGYADLGIQPMKVTEGLPIEAIRYQRTGTHTCSTCGYAVGVVDGLGWAGLGWTGLQLAGYGWA